MGCGRNESQGAQLVMESDSIPGAVKTFVMAVTEDDSVRLASIISYPLQRPYPLEDIETPDRMVGYYSTLIDDSLKQVVANAGPSDWNENGWRGWTIGDGRYVWVEDSLYDVPYVSARENSLRHELIRKEMETLDPSMRTGWSPVLCLLRTTDGTVYRIDIEEKPGDKPYRLAEYRKEGNLHGKPHRMTRGHKESEGTAMSDSYIFEDKDVSTIYNPDETDEAGNQVLLITDSKGNRTTWPVKKVYWRMLNK